MEILQEIGSYAGLAAVLGLAVLSALYFSQARDVKRLREWAGRAPERAPEATGVQPRVAAKPVPRAPGQAAAATQAGAPAAPGAKPVPPAPAGARAAAAAAGAAPATAVGPAAATPAARAEAAKADEAENGDDGDDSTNALSQDTVVHPPPTPPGEDEDEDGDEYDDGEDDFEDTGDHDQVSEEDDALDDDGDWEDTGEHDPTDPEAHWEDTGDEPALTAPRPATPAASRPIPPGAPVPAAATPAPASTETSGGGSILPPYAQSRPGGRADAGDGGGRRVFASRGRGIAVVAAGVLLLGGVVLGATQLLGGDDEPAPSGGGQNAAQNTPATETSANRPARRQRPNPRNVRVAVLNGTTVPGLAAQVGDQIERQGFRLGTVTNFNDQQRAESVVLYAPGAERAAAEVGRRLKISQREPIDAESQGVAGDATVAVVTGQDKTQ